MNQRIQELAKAYLVHERYTRYGEIVEEDLYEFYPDELEKFAELIIRECIQLCDRIDLVGADDCIDNIKEHFEIEQ